MSQQINLCNPLFRKQEKYFSALAMVQALGLILLGIVLFYAYLAYQMRSLNAQATQMSQMYDNAEHQLNRLASNVKAHQPSPLLVDRIAQSEQSLHTQKMILDLLQRGDLGNQTGFSAYLIGLSHQTVSGLWLTGFTIVGQADQLSLRGRALQPELIARLIQQLKNEPPFAGTHFATLAIHRPTAPATDSQATNNKASPVLPYIEFTLGKTDSEQVPE